MKLAGKPRSKGSKASTKVPSTIQGEYPAQTFWANPIDANKIKFTKGQGNEFRMITLKEDNARGILFE